MNIFKQKRLMKDIDRLIFYAILALAFFLALSPLLSSIALGVGVLLYLVKLTVSKPRQFRRTIFDVPIFCFTVISGLSVAISPDPAFSFYNYYNLVGRYVLTYVLVVQNIMNLQQLKSLVAALGSSAVVVVFYGFYQYIFGIDIASMKWVDPEAFPELKKRVFSTWVNPNILAGYLDVVMAVVFGLFCTLKDKKSRGLLAVFFCLLSICLAMTYARGACLSIAVVIAGYGLLKDRRILLACIALAAVILAADASLADRLLSVFTQMDTSSEMRLALWESTLAMIIDHPLFGIGWGAYWMVYPSYDFYINDAAVKIVHAHNMYLNFAAEIGVPGSLCFMAFFFGSMYHALTAKNLVESEFGRGLSLGCGLAILSIALNGLTDYVLFNIESSMLFWLIGAIVVLLEKDILD